VISTTVDGFISALHVVEGDTVTAGDPVAEILSSDYMDMQRRYLDASAAERLAAAQLERDQGLHADGIIADRRLQETSAAAQSASLALAQARQQLQIAGFDDAHFERLEAQRELSSVLTLVAPFSGVVVEQYVNVGASLESLAPVLRLADLGVLWLEARLPQEAARRIDERMQVQVELDGEMITGSIITVGQVVDSVTQTSLVRAVVDNANAHLLAGQFLTIEVAADAGGQPALAIPTGAVTREGGETFAFVRREGGVQPVRITLLGQGSDRVFVESGLSADAQIAVSGVSALKALWLAEDE
jgi:cobalt-zinc-cadmium efflux system membrane fusion protein